MPANREWVFFRDMAGLWQWERRSREGSVLLESHVGFDTLKKCIAHATGAGYEGAPAGGSATEQHPND